MKKILFISNISNKINLFAMSSIMAANKMGFSYHHVSNWSSASLSQIENEQKVHGIIIHNVGITRFPFSKSNYNAYRQIVDIIRRENIDYIHCNTPTGGVLGRLAGKKCRVSKVIYQAHGFHFYKGAPIINWLIYYPIERWLAHYTDALITINQEDYALAKEKMHLRRKRKVYYVPGVGIDTSQFPMDQAICYRTRQALNLSDTDVMLISAGELNENKNNTVIISALSKLNNNNIHYFLCGIGDKERKLRQQAEKAGIAHQIHFLGYRQDLKELLQAADIFVMPSFREGLSRSIMEAMSSGLPCVVSNIRGNVDLIRNGEGGFLCDASDQNSFAAAIERLVLDADLRKKMGNQNLMAIKQFDTSVVEKAMIDIYSEVLMEDKE